MSITRQGPNRSTGQGGAKARRAMESLLYGDGVDLRRKTQDHHGMDPAR
jgi:hypothetical protein